MSLDPSNSVNTLAEGINDSGEIVGFYQTPDLVYHGFSYNSGTGAYAPIDYNGATGTEALGVNNSGEVVGFYWDSAGIRHGFVLSSSGNFTTIDDPNAGSGGTLVGGINNKGQIVGWYTGTNGHDHGFIGVLTTLTGQSFSVNLNQSVALSSYLSLSNPTSDSLGSYWVEDLGGGSGHLTVGGTTVANGQWVQVGSNWSNVQYVGGPSKGTDTLDVTVYDSSIGSYVYSPTFTATTAALAANDFDGDGVSDILWRNTTTGEVDTWLLSGGHVNGGTGLGSTSGWQLVGTGYFNGDGSSDVLWRNTTTNAVESWVITNDHVTGGGGVGTASSIWQPLGTGDFNGDGTSDVLWRNTSTGEVDTWLMSNGHVSGGAAIDSVSSAWHLVGVGRRHRQGHQRRLVAQQ